jgi:hypothetical protein
MKEKLAALVQKAKDNKQIIIRVTLAVGVAALAGAGVALAVHLKNQNENPLLDDDFTGLEDAPRAEDEELEDEETDQ